ncbi:bifunctional 5,10-methylenetetrahydrofolate dehydrogenase/5,10-methenyltetrahydrofolate cyclohydrolase [Amycolatopsis palatopharyngis]|uniref:bifunctional 5,10-methylenetetrahydrofolate dehydrogenase/5,10-methenyltetrahydrofolate cyclohydrolase n=1 Tax=Amycolatopsis palatopharyngis TaxID=187982 RepID=UPI000E282DB7|nr:bifunctional 5,10-methylenetetrahydrofolate dehydrogenase/5,10-methenyltetrahydrofolate cyclohydrolase [Amycolatopsis palatopharyngis]
MSPAVATGPSTAQVLSGKDIAAELRGRNARIVDELADIGIRVKLAVVVATDDGSSHWYVRSIAMAAVRSGIDCEIVDLGADASAELIRGTLTRLSGDSAVHGIILQTPLPSGVAQQDLTSEIDPVKDVDGANPVSLGRLAAGMTAFPPATAEAVLQILDHYEVELAGRQAVIVGRSTVVGVPVAHLLLARHSTVTVCHSRTADLAEHTRRADVLVVAAGRAGLITAEHLSSGTTVIDVGTNPTDDGGLAGDVHAAEAWPVVDALTPVPGGVGPVTTALLLAHTVEAAQAAVRRTAS